MAVLIVLASAGLTGCDGAQVVVRIVDFDSSRVEGIRVWARDEASDEFVEALTVVFEGFDDRRSQELLKYTLWSEGEKVAPLMGTAITRGDTSQDEIVMRMLLLPLPGSGEYRISSFNAVGDSAMSETSFQI